MKFRLIIIFICLTSCASNLNNFFYKKKLLNNTDVQLIKSTKYKIDISDYELKDADNKIDSIQENIFKSKNIIFNQEKSKYILDIINFKYNVIKTSNEVRDKNGIGTGNKGVQLNISLQIESKIIDKVTGKSKLIKVGHEEVKIVYSDPIFDFFAIDSESSFSSTIPLKNCFNAMSHKVVKFIEKNEKK